MSLLIQIPNVTRDDRIGSVFNEIFSVIHMTEKTVFGALEE